MRTVLAAALVWLACAGSCGAARFIAFSDPHLDPTADPSLVPALMAADAADWGPILERDQTGFGQFGRDSTWLLVRSALDQMRSVEPDPAFLLLTGDLVVHRFRAKFDTVAPGRDDAEQGVGAHKDPGILTLLLIEPGKAGLQVERDGGWLDVPPVDGAFVVNIGELLEVATDGYLRATKHRVVSPPVGTERLSVPFFFNPSLDAEVPRIDLPPALAAHARGIEQDAANVLASRYGENLLKSRLRAHPDVARRHHPDLV